MTSPEEVGNQIQAMTIGDDDQENPSPETPRSQAELALRRGIDEILTKYPNRAAWQRAWREELQKVEDNLEFIRIESQACDTIIQEIGLTLLVRHTLIKNNYGNIGSELIQNQADWKKYIAEAQTAQEQVSKAVNWLNLFIDELNKQKETFTTFWDAFEGDEPIWADNLLGTVFVITLAYPPRQEFLEAEIEKTLPTLEVLEAKLPAWMEWDVVPRV